MFHTLITQLRRRDDERGIAMAGVIGVMAVGLLLTTVIASSIITGIGQTTSTRADVQSQASADAGIAAARAAIATGVCVGGAASVFTHVAPTYTATVYRPAGSGWTQGCPTTVASTDRVRIVSTGAAIAKGAVAVSSGDANTVEVILSGVTSTTTPGTPASVPLAASGPAVYAYSAGAFGGAGTLSGSNADVIVKTGNVNCSGASSGVDDWVVASGDLTVGASCSSSGNVWASGRVSLSGAASVGGNVVGAGVTLDGSSSVGGSVWSSADLIVPGAAHISGNVTAKSLSMTGSSNIRGDAWIYGAASLSGTSSIGGKLTAKSKSMETSTRAGSTSIIPTGPGASPYATPSAPTAPAWVDFTYVKADWAALGFSEYVYANCSGVPDLSKAIAAFGGSPGVIDARKCSSVTLAGADSVTLGSNVAIIANKFAFGGSGRISASSPTKLWLITPDTTPDGQPTCTTGTSLTIDGAFSIDSQISTMIYTPCLVSLGSATNLRGQVYAGKATIDGASHLAFDPVGLPGYNLSTGGSNVIPAQPGVTTVTPRTLVVYHNLAAQR